MPTCLLRTLSFKWKYDSFKHWSADGRVLGFGSNIYYKRLNESESTDSKSGPEYVISHALFALRIIL